MTCRPPSYSNVSVTSWPAMGDIGVGSLLVAAAATFVRGLRGGGFFVADPVDVGESAEAAFEDDVEPARRYCCNAFMSVTNARNARVSCRVVAPGRATRPRRRTTRPGPRARRHQAVEVRLELIPSPLVVELRERRPEASSGMNDTRQASHIPRIVGRRVAAPQDWTTGDLTRWRRAVPAYRLNSGSS